MDESEPVKIKVAGYENVSAECPFCKFDNIYNRASDFNSFEICGNRPVVCQSNKCGKKFRIISDSINNSFEMVLFDCEYLKGEKKYMSVILHVTQAYEMFFRLYLFVELAWKPYFSTEEGDIDELNDLMTKLNSKIEKRSYYNMKKLFLNEVLCENKPQNLSTAICLVERIPEEPTEPKDKVIRDKATPSVAKLLLALKAAKVVELRNKVVHSGAYRPTRDDAKSVLDEARNNLSLLAHTLGIHDDMNWYRPDRHLTESPPPSS